MQGKPSPIDAGRAWTEAMAMLNGQRDILLTLAGFFIMLPALLLGVLRPFEPSGSSESMVRELLVWTNQNFLWVVLVAAMAALGRLAILILLFYIFGRIFLAETAFVAIRARGPLAGISASFEATRGNGWRIFLVSALIYIGGFILTAALGSVLGAVGALLGGTGLARVLGGLVEAACGAGVSLVLVLVSVAFWRQLADQGHVRGGAFG
jgi:hypothetical protein